MKDVIDGIVVAALAGFFVALILVPWLSIVDIHKSIDKVADEIKTLNIEVSKLRSDLRKRGDNT